MKFQVGRFTCEVSLDSRGEVEALWLRWQPKYLNEDETTRHRAGGVAFLEAPPHEAITDVVDRHRTAADGACKYDGQRSRREASREPVSNLETAAISLALPRLQAMALSQFVQRLDFNAVTQFAGVTVVCTDGKSEADLVWLALIALRDTLAEASKMRREK